MRMIAALRLAQRVRMRPTFDLRRRRMDSRSSPTMRHGMRISITATALLATMLILLRSCPALAADEMETRTGRIEVSYRFPPASDFSKLVIPIAKRYGIAPPADSFDALRAIELDDKGAIKPKPAATGPSPTQPATPASNDAARYSIYVPQKYDPRSQPVGVIVWIAPEEGVGFRQEWREVLDRHGIVFVEPDAVPNTSHVVWRAFMATEAARQAKRHFNVDPDRVYIAGFSGGGRVASHAAMFFADVFDGCFAMCGCNFYRDVPAGENKVWPGFWRSPEANLVKLARARSRFVLLTGTEDFNRESTKAVADAMTAEKFAHVTFLDIPGMEHKIGYVTADWFEKGLAALDEPVFELAEATYQLGLDQEKKGQRGEAILSWGSAARHGRDHAWVKDAKDRAAALRKQFDEQLAIIRKQVDDRK